MIKSTFDRMNDQRIPALLVVVGRCSIRVLSILSLCLSVLTFNVVADESLGDDDDESSESTQEIAMKDPTRPLSYVAPNKAKAKNSWRLDSVLISSQRKLAVINGEFVKEQGWVKGAQVTQIETGRVTIMVKGKPRVLTLSTDIRKAKVEG